MRSKIFAGVAVAAAAGAAVVLTARIPPALAADRAVTGARPAFAEEVSIRVEGDVRVIRSNGIPAHETGQFPNRGNPNTIAPQHYEFRVPAEPKVADKLTPLRMQPFGVAVNGVVFDPGAAEWWNRDRTSGWQYEPLFGGGMLGVDQSQEKMVLVGWAADGFPIYNPVGYSNPADAESAVKSLKSSYRVKKGTRPNGPGGAYDGTFVADYEYVAGAGNLDECNGLTGVTPEYPKGIYHYVLTEEFPFVPRMYRGTPDASFAVHGGPGVGGAGARGPGGGGGGGQRPLPAIVRALDANGDGVISAAEIANAPVALKKLDQNGDGKLTPDEYLGPRPGGGGPRGGGGPGQ
jgi:hypothetical protein